jgi:hypothetical protein
MNKRRKQQIAYVKLNRKKINQKNLQHAKNMLMSWSNSFLQYSNCEICNKPIKFLDKHSPICFDHRYDGTELIQMHPSNWLARNRFSEENFEIWKKCDFGILCRQCNSRLPTKNRKEFLIGAIKYVFKNI